MENGSLLLFSAEYYFQLCLELFFYRTLDSSSCSFHETVNRNQKIWLRLAAAEIHLSRSVFSVFLSTELYLHSPNRQ